MRSADETRRQEYPAADGLHLSQREAEVLVCLWDGLQIKGAAARMGLSDRTVKNYAGTLFAKLGAHSQVQCVRRALELGLLRVVPDGQADGAADMEVPG